MNRWIANVVTFASLAGVVALVPAGIAYAQQDAAADGGTHRGHHGHPMGLVAAALKLDSLSPAQRSAIEQLVATRRTAESPVRLADAQVLTALAQQVEQASINKQALAPSVSQRENAALAARAVDLETAQKLHDLLTPAQRTQLVDSIEAHFQGHGFGKGDAGGPSGHEHLAEIAKKLGLTDQQKAQIAANLRAERQGEADGGPHGDPGARKAWLESFRGDTFNATAAAAGEPQRMELRADRIEDLLVAAVPVLSPAQRAELASHLRARAAHESRS